MRCGIIASSLGWPTEVCVESSLRSTHLGVLLVNGVPACFVNFLFFTEDTCQMVTGNCGRKDATSASTEATYDSWCPE